MSDPIAEAEAYICTNLVECCRDMQTLSEGVLGHGAFRTVEEILRPLARDHAMMLTEKLITKAAVAYVIEREGR